MHETFNGVDARTGMLVNVPTGGSIVGQEARLIAGSITNLADGVEQNEAMLPRFDDNGNVYAYQRLLDPDKVNMLNVDDHIGRNLGAWAGRILEERISKDINKELVAAAKAQYDRDVLAGNASQYTNVADRNYKDPVIKDAWDVLGNDIKSEAAKVFGKKNFFPVRNDMEELVLGFRQASVRDLWSDKSRTNQELRKGIRDTLSLFGRENTYKRMVQAEELIQDAVSYAKGTILIRSVVVLKNL